MKKLYLASFLIPFQLMTLAGNPDNALHWNQSRGYEPFRYATPHGIHIDNSSSGNIVDYYNFETASHGFTLSFRAANLNAHPSKQFTYYTPDGKKSRRKNPEWHFFALAGNDTIMLTVKSEEKTDAFTSFQAVSVAASLASDNSIIASTTVADNIDCFSGINLWKLTLSDNALRIDAGNSRLHTIIDAPIQSGPFSGFGFAAGPAACLEVTNITASTHSSKISPQTPWSNLGHLQDYLNESKDEMEGYWTVFDRTLEESLLLLGGDYQFAIVRDEDRYLIIYLSGARVNACLWKAGMIKGVLTPGPFPGIYSVDWTDSEGLKMNHDIKAQAGEGGTLSIQFPYQSSVIRLRRIAKP